MYLRITCTHQNTHSISIRGYILNVATELEAGALPLSGDKAAEWGEGSVLWQRALLQGTTHVTVSAAHVYRLVGSKSEFQLLQHICHKCLLHLVLYSINELKKSHIYIHICFLNCPVYVYLPLSFKTLS